VPDLAVRLRLLAALALVTPLGFATKAYTGPLQHWVRYSAGGILYVAFWMLVVLLLRPRVRPVAVAAGVLVATSLLEVLQLWHPPLLEALRAHFLGRTLLGTTFSWSDFPHYVAGAGLGLMLARAALGSRAWPSPPSS